MNTTTDVWLIMGEANGLPMILAISHSETTMVPCIFFDKQIAEEAWTKVPSDLKEMHKARLIRMQEVPEWTH